MDTRPGRPPEALERALAARGYRSLTPVQRAVTAAGARGADLLVSAPPGSGKTVAFGLAIAEHLAVQVAGDASPERPRALVVVPTRELARQVAGELGWLLAGLGARVVCCIGGTDPGAERAALARGADVVVGSAGRLRDHVTRRGLATEAIGCVVLDEADDMLSRGFRDDLEFLLEAVPPDRQILMFSATVSPAVERLAGRYQRAAQRLDIGDGRSRATIQGLAVAPADREAAVARLLRLHDAPAALVFCSRRAAVASLAAGLARRGFAVVALSGALDQRERDAAVAAMRAGRARVCVATDVAARGLDLPGLDLVVHADLPANAEALLHRSGRSGRTAVPGNVALLIAGAGERRRAQRLAGRAGLAIEWTAPPGPEALRARDLERLLAYVAAARQGGPDDAAAALLAARAPEELAAALVRLWRGAQPDGADPAAI